MSEPIDNELMMSELEPNLTVEGFDPMRQVAQNDLQVRHALSVRPDFNVAQSMWGFYTCERMLGKSILEAWKSTLTTVK